MTQTFTRKQVFPRRKVKRSVPDEVGKVAKVRMPKTETIATDDDKRLYKDIRFLFRGMKAPKLRSTRLIKLLCSDPDWPWATFNDGGPLNAWQLNRMLKPFDIHSKAIWFRKLKISCRGFLKEWFSEKLSDRLG